MSVLVADLEVFNYVAQGVKLMANTSLNANFESSLYSKAAREHFTGKNVSAESMRLAKSWVELNERTYDGRYDEVPEQNRLSSFIDFRSVDKIEAIQLMNYFFCIVYNIEEEYAQPTPSEEKDLALLRDLMLDCRTSYLTSLPEWKAIPTIFTGTVADLNGYKFVLNGVIKVAFNRTCDDFYSYTINCALDKDPIGDAKLLVASWMDLSQGLTSKTEKNLSELLVAGTVPVKSAVQLVKYLQAIRNNIGTFNPSADILKKNIKILDALIEDLTWSIIQFSPEYKLVKYSTL